MCDGGAAPAAAAAAAARRRRAPRSVFRVHYALQRRPAAMARPLATDPADIVAYEQQVAGHTDTKDAKYLGLLQCTNGTILKPLIKESQRREAEFYERLESASASDAELLEVRRFVPKYFGCTRFAYNGHEQDYVVLEHLTHGMLEPCVMDVKIGRRTWDPLASEDKIRNEQRKYAACKRQYAFCIPGYQVFRLGCGRRLRHGKEHGKRLQGDAVKDAIRTYLNGDEGPLCRALLLQFLAQLWRVQRCWARQRAVRLYSASLLLVYDVAGLRDCCPPAGTAAGRARGRAERRRRHSAGAPAAGGGGAGAGAGGGAAAPGASFSGQLSADGPVFKKVSPVPLSPMSRGGGGAPPAQPPALASPWAEALERLTRSHSFDHNYEDKLSQMKINYRVLLDRLLSDAPAQRPRAAVKVIDFAHAFFNEEHEKAVDDNFKEGVDSLVAIFESFLKETDDQV